ncbi:hypothetical protein [Microbaculum marinisediminis]|uniref:Uncharacterized protein n=1 Tax=Microbaculum marinisediminis TaxID=2931392 RepID=A0AAW5QSB4_9HYPH|nr:hypothetical protein [Microbaculum sp. A6E488]MCT8970548.1 hypothetical protein [Microbaculum sp. A6E488]
MAKGQKRSTKEPKKQKAAEKKTKKLAGPKYLRQSEMIQSGKAGIQRLGLK